MISRRRRSFLWGESTITFVKWKTTSSISSDYLESSYIRTIEYIGGNITDGAQVTSNVSWILCSVQGTQVNISIEENSSGYIREAEITLIPPEGCRILGSDTIKISQKSTQYFTLQTSSTSGGSISVNPNKSKYTRGDVVTITATPSSGYVFAGFSENSSETSSSIGVNMNPSLTKTLTMYKDETVRSVFRDFIYLLAEGDNGQSTILYDDTGSYMGEISSNPSIKVYKSAKIGTSEGSGILRIKYSLKEPFALYNIEPKGMTLDSTTDYSGQVLSFLRLLVITSTTRKDQYWKFNYFDKSSKMMDFTTSPYIKESENDNVGTSGGGSTSPSSYSGKYGSTVRVTASPNSGYKFLSWEDGGSQTHDAVLMTKQVAFDYEPDRITGTLKAYFISTSQSITSYAVSVYSDNSSMGAVSPSSKNIEKGGSATFYLYPKSGYKFSKTRWSGNSNGLIVVNEYEGTLTVSDIVGDCSIYVEWKNEDQIDPIPTYVTLSIGASSGGSGSRGAYAYPVNDSNSISSSTDSDFIGNSVWNSISSSSHSYKYGSEVALCALDLEDSNKFVRWSDGNTSPFRILTLTSDISIYPVFTYKSTSSSDNKSNVYLNGKDMSWSIYEGYPIFTLISDIFSRDSKVTVNSVSYTKFMFYLDGGYRIPIVGDGSSRIDITVS